VCESDSIVQVAVIATLHPPCHAPPCRKKGSWRWLRGGGGEEEELLKWWWAVFFLTRGRRRSLLSDKSEETSSRHE
jgi:hypothetical protein